MNSCPGKCKVCGVAITGLLLGNTAAPLSSQITEATNAVRSFRRQT